MTDSDATARLAAHFDAHAARLYRLATPPEQQQRGSTGTSSRRPSSAPLIIPSRLPAEAAAGEAWLVRTLVNLCRDRWRRQEVRRRRTESPAVPAILRTPKPQPRQENWSALPWRSSPPGGGLSPCCAISKIGILQDIARLLGISQVTVRWHLAAARQQLRRHLGDNSRKPS